LLIVLILMVGAILTWGQQELGLRAERWHRPARAIVIVLLLMGRL
jgi:hypothetical protein